MMKKLFLILLVLFIFVPALCSEGSIHHYYMKIAKSRVSGGCTLLDQYPTSAGHTTFSSTSRFFISGEYDPTSTQTVTQVEIAMFRVGSPGNNISAKIWNSDHSTTLATSTNSIASTSISNAFGDETFYTFAFAGIALSSGTAYHIGLAVDGLGDGSNYLKMHRDAETGWDIERSVSENASWVNSTSDQTAMMKIYYGSCP